MEQTLLEQRVTRTIEMVEGILETGMYTEDLGDLATHGLRAKLECYEAILGELRAGKGIIAIRKDVESHLEGEPRTRQDRLLRSAYQSLLTHLDEIQEVARG